MRVLLQRVVRASVDVEGAELARIGAGLVALVGIAPGDGPDEVQWMADKVLQLRIFADDNKPMNRSVLDSGGEVLLVSQFTLTADTSRGRRPSFTSSAAPEQAERIYDQFVAAVQQRLPAGQKVQTGRFGADMMVALVNDGPVTFLLER